MGKELSRRQQWQPCPDHQVLGQRRVLERLSRLFESVFSDQRNTEIGTSPERNHRDAVIGIDLGIMGQNINDIQDTYTVLA